MLLLEAMRFWMLILMLLFEAGMRAIVACMFSLLKKKDFSLRQLLQFLAR